MRTKLLASLLFISTLLSCDSEKDTAPAPAPEPIKTFGFSFRYDPVPRTIKDYELIVSQKDGSILLDTLVTAGSHHALKVKSNETKFDVTTIIKIPETTNHILKTYVNVNPDKWHIDEGFSTFGSRTTERSELRYYNIPYDRTHIFSSKQAEGTASSWPNTTDNILFLNFARLLPTDLAYILLVNYEKYLFTEVSSTKMDIDFSGANTALRKKYDRPAGATDFRSFLFGYTKAGDYANRMLLYNSDRQPSDEYDFLYPSTTIEEFEFNLIYTDAKGYRHSYRNISTLLPSVMNFAAESDFIVAKQGFNDFEIKFGEDKPSSYLVFWVAKDVTTQAQWYTYSSPDEKNIIPKDFLENLKAKSLAGKNLSTFKLYSVQTEKARGYTHQTLRDYLANPEALRKKEMKQTRLIEKTF
ncbi:hypothetical protein [Pontibacter ruber]|uniref:Lipoprotein n=1 Tax=Pontibacter ruber TaxID=1343895 RepID=A0ABW5CYP3_9BACT|nr:hypothetical protein [Pontibacter ruber]